MVILSSYCNCVNQGIINNTAKFIPVAISHLIRLISYKVEPDTQSILLHGFDIMEGGFNRWQSIRSLSHHAAFIAGFVPFI